MLKPNKNLILLIIGVAGVIIVGALIFSGVVPFQKLFASIKTPNLSLQEVGQKAINHINNNYLKGGTTAILLNVEKVSGLVKIRIKIGNNESDSYATLDGKLLFAQAFYMTGDQTQNPANAAGQTQNSCDTMKKTEKPVLDAFIVSNCPYGLQMQRILAEIIKNIPSLASNIKVRYIGKITDGKLTSMHGPKEAEENLRQICIREEMKENYWNYISCFLKKKDQAENCLQSVGINSKEVNACIADTSRGLKYAQEDVTLTDKYGATSSPTLILNEGKVSENGFGGRTAEAVKSVLCCGFSGKPDTCSQKLTTNKAVTSYSEVYASSTASVSSGSGCQ